MSYIGNHDIVCIGGSSGATAPLKAILGNLPADLPAAVFVVLHMPARSLGILAIVSAANPRLPVHQATEGMLIEPGHIYLAVPDHHLMLDQGRIRLGRGPRENMVRPAIDPMFRSAASAYGSRVIAVVLSGLLNDGAAGLAAVTSCGGLAVVQDPMDAVADEMPRGAMQAAAVDLLVPGSRLGAVLSELVREAAGPTETASPEIRLEVEIAAGEQSDSRVIGRLATPSTMTCPTCQGVMSQVRGGKPLRFRCQVGHAMTAEIMEREQEASVDDALRIALRVIEERVELVTRMAEDASDAARPSVATLYNDRAVEYRRYADTLRRAVMISMSPVEPAGDEDPEPAS